MGKKKPPLFPGDRLLFLKSLLLHVVFNINGSLRTRTSGWLDTNPLIKSKSLEVIITHKQKYWVGNRSDFLAPVIQLSVDNSNRGFVQINFFPSRLACAATAEDVLLSSQGSHEEFLQSWQWWWDVQLDAQLTLVPLVTSPGVLGARLPSWQLRAPFASAGGGSTAPRRYFWCWVTQDLADGGKREAMKTVQCWWDWERRLGHWGWAVEMEGRRKQSAKPAASAEPGVGGRCCVLGHGQGAVSVPSEGGAGSNTEQHVGM